MPEGLRGGTPTYWRCFGDGPAEVLLLHCSLAHSGAWDEVAGRRLGLPSVAPDAPGHGRSGAPDTALDYGDQCTSQAAAFLGPEPIDIIGHSFGGVVALRLALEHPGQVRRLVLIEPVLFAAARGRADYARMMVVFEPYRAALAEGDTDAAARAFTDAWGTGRPWSSIPEAQRRAMAERIGLIGAQDGALIDDNAGLLSPGRLEGLEIPVLLIGGGRSPSIAGAVLDVLEDRLPRTERVAIQDAGHMSPTTHPNEVSEAIAAFLSRA